jgi:hypothetical protein
MRSVLTQQALECVPEQIRHKLNLRPGSVVDFDENVPFLKANPVSSSEKDSANSFSAWVASSLGLTKGKLTTDQRMAETRGEG